MEQPIDLVEYIDNMLAKEVLLEQISEALNISNLRLEEAHVKGSKLEILSIQWFHS